MIAESDVDGTLDCDHLDAYVHNAFEWKIGLGDWGVGWCAPYNGYKYGVDNQSTMARGKRPGRPCPPISSTAIPSQADPSSAGEGQLRKRKAKTLRVIEIVSPVKKSGRGASHRGFDKSVPSGSQVAPYSLIAVPPSPAEEVVTLLEDYASGDEGRTAVVSSPICKR